MPPDRQAARERVRSERRHAAPVAGPHREDLLAAFLGAAAGGDLGALRSLLRDDAVLVSDGGPNRRAARYPIVGAERIARFIATLAARVPRDASFELLPVNGVRGVLIRWDGSPQTLIFGEDDGERLVSVWVVRGEAKLRQFEQPSA